MELSLRKNVDHFDTMFDSLLISKAEGKKIVGYISTYNIDVDERIDELIQLFDEVHLVVNTSPLRNRIENDKSKLINLLNYSNVSLYLNRLNHSKIIAYDGCAYIGSCNLSGPSFSNIEAGVFSKDESFVLNLINDFKEVILSQSSDIRLVAKNFNNYSINNVVNQLIPEYESIISRIIEVENLSDYTVAPDPAKIKLNKLQNLIVEIKEMHRKAIGIVSLNELNVIPNLNMDGLVSALEDIYKNIEEFRADGSALITAAEKRGLDLSNMLMIDFKREFGDSEIMDDFLRNECVFDELTPTLLQVTEEMKDQVRSVKTYLKALLWFGNKCRELNIPNK